MIYVNQLDYYDIDNMKQLIDNIYYSKYIIRPKNLTLGVSVKSESEDSWGRINEPDTYRF